MRKPLEQGTVIRFGDIHAEVLHDNGGPKLSVREEQGIVCEWAWANDGQTCIVVESPPGEGQFVIRSESEQGYWSNIDGWTVVADDAERYENIERYSLPITIGNDAKWVRDDGQLLSFDLTNECPSP